MTQRTVVSKTEAVKRDDMFNSENFDAIPIYLNKYQSKYVISPVKKTTTTKQNLKAEVKQLC